LGQEKRIIRGTAMAGIKIGHATDEQFNTGCTVFICPDGTVGSVDVRGPAPGSRETALLAADKRDIRVNAVVLTGGSAFGLATADGVMRFLAERGIGHCTPIRPIPIVAGAVVYDLFLGSDQRPPDAEMGYRACLDAVHESDSQGNVGAGRGVTVGKWGEFANIMKGGFGLASMEIGDLQVGAAAVVNAVGDILSSDGSVLAGAQGTDGGWAVDENPLRFIPRQRELHPGTNTTLVVVATNARMSKPEVNRLAQRAHDGIAIAIRPAHTYHDGDTAFALATGTVEAEYNLVANIVVEVVSEAIRNGVRHAAPLGSIHGLGR
jgi:L-aminopeptidase/D-esterase-like protein